MHRRSIRMDDEAMDYQHPQPQEARQVATPMSNDSDAVQKGYVSCLHKCPSEDAKTLCIYDIGKKIKVSGSYDIGGTYTGNTSDLWFYFSTSVCLGNNYLLNLLVCHRKTGHFTVGIRNSIEFNHKHVPNQESPEWSVSPQSMTWHTFKSAQPNEIFHIRTYYITEKNMQEIEENTLYIPIAIDMTSSLNINNEIVKSIKLRHDLSGLLAEKEKTDFVLISQSGRKFPVHKMILFAHSPILRSVVKDTEQESFIDIQDSDMELLLEFLYTGTVKDMFGQNSMNLLQIADKFQLQNLFLLTQYAFGEKISVDTAVEIALISQKHELHQLRDKVFRFIKNNPKVMKTKSWIELNNTELMKQLIEYISSG